MVTDKTTLITRRAMLSAFAAATVVAAPTFSNAAGFLRGAGDIRKLSMMSRRTGERISTYIGLMETIFPKRSKKSAISCAIGVATKQKPLIVVPSTSWRQVCNAEYGRAFYHAKRIPQRENKRDVAPSISVSCEKFASC